MVNVTPKAVAKIRQAFAKEGVTGGLRLGVQGGGCSGLSYMLRFETKPRATDNPPNPAPPITTCGRTPMGDLRVQDS